MKRFLIIIFSLFYSLTIFSQVVDGVADLRNRDLSKEIIQLDGNWNIYWKRFITQDSLADPDCNPDGFIQIPLDWNDQIVNDIALPKYGFATYHCHILLPELKKDEFIAFKNNSLGTSGEFYVNGQLLKTVGVVSADPLKAKPGLESFIVRYKPQGNSLDVIIHLSNYSYRSAGVWNPITFSSETTMRKNHQHEITMQFFLIGSVLIMALFYFGFYFLQRESKMALFYSLFLLVLTVRLFFSGEFLINYFFHFNGFLIRKVEFITFFGAVFPFILTYRNVFKKNISKKFTHFIATVSVGSSLFVLFFPEHYFGALLLPFQLFTLIFGGYILFKLIYLTIIKVKGAFIFLLSFIVLLSAVVNDILSAMSVIHTPFILSYGLFGFVFFQSFALASLFANSFKLVSKLSEDLNIANKTLELRVEERTNELKGANESLNEINIEISQQNAEIAAQRDEVEKQRDIAQNHYRNITDSINYASRIQNAVFPSVENFKKAFPDSFIFFKPRDVVSGDFYYFRENEENYFIAVADCTGHGVPGAFMSLLGISFLNEIIISQKIIEPDLVLNALRTKLINAINQGENEVSSTDGIDIALVKIHKKTGNLSYSGAYNSLIMSRNGQINIFKADKMPIGVHRKSKIPFTRKEIQLETDDQIILFSDGFIDQLGGDYFRKYTSNRFIGLIEEIQYENMSKQVQRLDEELIKWKKGISQNDDILILSIKI